MSFLQTKLNLPRGCNRARYRFTAGATVFPGKTFSKQKCKSAPRLIEGFPRADAAQELALGTGSCCSAGPVLKLGLEVEASSDLELPPLRGCRAARLHEGCRRHIGHKVGPEV
jgi:hypothetical protein